MNLDDYYSGSYPPAILTRRPAELIVPATPPSPRRSRCRDDIPADETLEPSDG